jgi:hypothetical protein
MNLRGCFLLVVVCGPGAALVGQTASAVALANPPSAMLQPALDVLRTAVGAVSVERWKGPSSARSEVETNVASIRRDIGGTLPGLLAAADAAPGSAAKMLPAYRNVEALYEVLLRVDVAARASAPSEQSSALDQALRQLEDGRKALADRLQDDAAAAEKKAGDLQAQLKAIPPPALPQQPVVCPAPAPVKKKAKPVVKPSAPATTPQSPAAPSQ